MITVILLKLSHAGSDCDVNTGSVTTVLETVAVSLGTALCGVLVKSALVTSCTSDEISWHAAGTWCEIMALRSIAIT